MGPLATFIAWAAALATAFIERGGYVGIFLLMAAESTVLPVPSEAVMPPAGILAADGRLDVGLVALVATVGTLVGSWVGYVLGRAGGEAIVRRHARWLLLRESHIDQAADFYRRRGFVAVLVSRFIPGLRHVSSIPAGAARMPLGPFFLATFLGGGLWNLTLLWAGYSLGRNWDRVMDSMRYAEVVALGVLVVAIATWWVVRRRRNARKAA